MLGARELCAARSFIDAVLREVPAELIQASLFGSRARGEARPDSDVDVLLVFARLPPDREPQATLAERLAEQAASESGIPIAAWSVSLIDLEPGNRTPMLVDSLEDAIPLWWRHRPLPCLTFGPADALHCVSALLDRIDEGSAEFAANIEHGSRSSAARRVRDDLVRACTAGLLLRGITRPRRGAAVRAFTRLLLAADPPPPSVLATLRWAAESFGADGNDEDAPLREPPGGLPAAVATLAGLRRGVLRGAERLARQVDRSPSPPPTRGNAGMGVAPQLFSRARAPYHPRLRLRL
jgi:predicted nucleotidyltransferase